MWRRLAASPHEQVERDVVQLVERRVAGGGAVRRLTELLCPQPVGDQLAEHAEPPPGRAPTSWPTAQ